MSNFNEFTKCVIGISKDGKIDEINVDDDFHINAIKKIAYDFNYNVDFNSYDLNYLAMELSKNIVVILISYNCFMIYSANLLTDEQLKYIYMEILTRRNYEYYLWLKDTLYENIQVNDLLDILSEQSKSIINNKDK